jgi:hypothetical protein
MGLPPKLLACGVKDMVRVSDARGYSLRNGKLQEDSAGKPEQAPGLKLIVPLNPVQRRLPARGQHSDHRNRSREGRDPKIGEESTKSYRQFLPAVGLLYSDLSMTCSAGRPPHFALIPSIVDRSYSVSIHYTSD